MRTPNAVPGGGPMPRDRAKNAKKATATSNSSQSALNAIQKGGKGPARCYGQDLMRGEHKLGETASHHEENLTHCTTIHLYDGGASEQTQSGTSIFDPVLCELAYRWFCVEGGSVLDPFAGGSVRGIVAAWLGRRYTGVDLSERQVEANRAQWDAIKVEGKPDPLWLVGDSVNITEVAHDNFTPYDFIFSCPPYFDLEIYSEDPKDLSTMTYADFLTAYRAIIKACVWMLKPNMFACFVVGDIRDKYGFYRNFTGATIAAFEDAGATLYNQGVLVTALGSLPIRVGRQFGKYRKLGKTHQDVLVFFNGDPKDIPEHFGECDYTLDLVGTEPSEPEKESESSENASAP